MQTAIQIQLDTPGQSPYFLSLRHQCENWLRAQMERYAGCLSRPAPDGDDETVALLLHLPKSHADGLIVVFGECGILKAAPLIHQYPFYRFEECSSSLEFRQIIVGYLI